ncbi:MAG: hypothetical protein FWD25_01865 [Clostridia bacterium]|nr:hypothetical protein [Clostridia bacterium]
MALTPSDCLEKRTSQIFVCDVWPCDTFSLVPLDGVPYIIATGKIPWPINADHLIIGDTSILLSLLDLHSRLMPAKNLDRRNIANYENECSTADIEIICRWCEKHGSPFPPVKANDWIGIRLGDFRIKLNRLYRAYDTWRGIALEADKTEAEKEQLQDKLNTLNRCPIYIHVDYSLSAPRLFFRCMTMFDLAHTQLSFMAASQLDWSLAICDNCSLPFAKHHGNQKLCPHCNQTRYQACRDRKRKERKKNAQESQQ